MLQFLLISSHNLEGVMLFPVYHPISSTRFPGVIAIHGTGPLFLYSPIKLATYSFVFLKNVLNVDDLEESSVWSGTDFLHLSLKYFLGIKQFNIVSSISVVTSFCFS